MELKDKLKILRTARNLTQEEMAEYLGISAQTVSKWERGLSAPDIMLLPKIALLCQCSIDSLFDMDSMWGREHQKSFEKKLDILHVQQDWEGIYAELIREIELNPDSFGYYRVIMAFVLRHDMFDDERIKKMISLADRAEKLCTDHSLCNELYRLMIQICGLSKNKDLRAQAKYYYKKLPLLMHSREVYACYVLEGEELEYQEKSNVISSVEYAVGAIKQLIVPDMPPAEKIHYYKKAAVLWETVLDNKYGGHWDVQLLDIYTRMAALYMQMGMDGEASEYVDRTLGVLERHLCSDAAKKISVLLHSPLLPKAEPMDMKGVRLLNKMLEYPDFAPYKERISEFIDRYSAFYSASKK